MKSSLIAAATAIALGLSSGVVTAAETNSQSPWPTAVASVDVPDMARLPDAPAQASLQQTKTWDNVVISRKAGGCGLRCRAGYPD